MQTNNLKQYTTKDLVTELETREGVEYKIVEPYEDYNISVNGSAIILIVID